MTVKGLKGSGQSRSQKERPGAYRVKEEILDVAAVFWKGQYNISQQPDEVWKSFEEQFGVFLSFLVSSCTRLIC